MSDSPRRVLDDLRALGIEVRIAGEKLQMRSAAGGIPPDIAARVRACKAELLLLLAPECRADRVLLDDRWCPVVWLDTGVVAQPPRCDCMCCHARRWWRLRGEESAGRPWVCAVCHPPSPPAHEIEWAEASDE